MYIYIYYTVNVHTRVYNIINKRLPVPAAESCCNKRSAVTPSSMVGARAKSTYMRLYYIIYIYRDRHRCTWRTKKNK